MSHETSLTQEEQHIEAILGQCRPMADVPGRDKLMFEAGRMSAGHVRLWQCVSGVCAMVLLCSLTMRVTPSTPEPAIVTPQFASNQWHMPPEGPIRRPVDTQAYIHVRHRVLEQGLDALPDARGGRAGAADRMQYGQAMKRYMAL
ncbi:MAG: hypothetical protein K9N55_07875 [Phycisphaerae bacterium]|nr:hypothetical protein [Phycisphaerae bacterium]